ncbi:MAG: M1 family aminopeptidase [Bacteroidales bacterium]|nr:M1 family aminopeptidase [Bacteroidales bacterium]
MKHITKTLFFLLIFLSISPVKAQKYSLAHEQLIRKERRSYQAISNFVENPAASDWDLTYNRLEFFVDPHEQYIKGNVFFQFSSLKDNLNTLVIDLDDSLTVTSVVAGNTPCSYTHTEGFIHLTLPTTLQKKDTGSFTISYQGSPILTGIEAFVQDTQQDPDSTPVIYTLSEPYGAKEWWPCKESLSDKIDSIDIIVHSPAPFRTASNGILVSDTVIGDQRTCHWQHRHPIVTYLVFISNTIYEVYSDWATLSDGSKVEILNYVYPASLDTARLSTPVTAQYLEYFSNLFMDYPFKDEKYGHAQFGWNGGMEHQTMTSMGSFEKDLIAHELAHQWFGDYITCGSWHEIWLNEGFATYMEMQILEAFDPVELQKYKDYVIKYITAYPGGSVYVSDISDVDRLFNARLSYFKGCYVLLMLRELLGDEAFFAGINRYLRDPRVADGFSTTDLFRENMEQAGDTTLTDYFDTWIYGKGHPVYDIRSNHSGSELHIDISQQPSDPNGPFFRMKLPVTLYTGGKEETYWLTNTVQDQQFTLYAPVAPDSVKFNKGNKILCQFQENYTSLSDVRTQELSLAYDPSGHCLTVVLDEAETAHYELYDQQGRRVQTGKWEANHPVISTALLPPGIYNLLLTTSQKSYSVKVSCR